MGLFGKKKFNSATLNEKTPAAPKKVASAGGKKKKKPIFKKGFSRSAPAGRRGQLAKRDAAIEKYLGR